MDNLLPIQVRNKTCSYREIIARLGIDVCPMPSGVLSVIVNSVVVLVFHQPSFDKMPDFHLHLQASTLVF